MNRTMVMCLCITILLPVTTMAGEEAGNELTGIFHQEQAKNPAYLEVDGSGFIARIIVTGDVLKTIPNNTRLWVKGSITTNLYGLSDQFRKHDQQAPTQWFIVFHVEKCIKITKPFEKPADGDIMVLFRDMPAPPEHTPVGAQGIIPEGGQPMADDLRSRITDRLHQAEARGQRGDMEAQLEAELLRQMLQTLEQEAASEASRGAQVEERSGASEDPQETKLQREMLQLMLRTMAKETPARMAAETPADQPAEVEADKQEDQ